MTALDSCEPQIIRALEKAGGRILDKPYPIPAEENPVIADFRSQVMLDNELKIIVVVEVKCFTHAKTDLPELYNAVGQYFYYQVSLRRAKRDFPLYLAIPSDAYLRFFDKPTFMDTLAYAGVKLLVVDTVEEEIIGWID